MEWMAHLSVSLALSMMFLVISAQEAPAAENALTDHGGSRLIDPTLSEVQNQFLDQQARAFLDLIDDTLQQYHPQLPERAERRLALFLLDSVLHDVYAPKRLPVQVFFHDRIRRAIEQIENVHVRDGAMIWKLYNHGFVVRTATVTFAFDLVRARLRRTEEFALSDTLMKRLVDQCDALFISHRHGDHADEWVAQAFRELKKPVVAPPEVWKDRPIHADLTHLKREAQTVQVLPIQNGRRKLRVVNYPGHQGASIENNVPLVFSPEGMSFCQMGDQSNNRDFAWIDSVGSNHRVDVLLPNCWTTDIVRTVRGFDPELVITGHENEMGHTIDHREPYWLTYQRKIGSDRFGGSRLIGYDVPLLVMTWGEAYHYRPPTRAKAKP
jgi:L-ascorbate metabolism protein UlaG (beta-lactamase superfamily)